MPERSKKFHEFAIKSILFKGHTDLYLCYLKAEKVAHVLSVLQTRSAADAAKSLDGLVSAASRLPETVVHFAAGEIDITVVLADIFSLISATRLAATQLFIAKENSAILAGEYEQLADKIAGGIRLSPFLNEEDFLLPSLPQVEGFLPLLPSSETLPLQSPIKDIKGQEKVIKDKQPSTQGQSKRAGLILEFVRKHKNVSIKDIAKVIKGFSEKTIQRELSSLIQQGLVEKRGERRWSIYSPK
jgi:DNA-binding transcriptional ArsR family regulator